MIDEKEIRWPGIKRRDFERRRKTLGDHAPGNSRDKLEPMLRQVRKRGHLERRIVLKPGRSFAGREPAGGITTGSSRQGIALAFAVLLAAFHPRRAVIETTANAGPNLAAEYEDEKKSAESLPHNQI